MTIPGAKRQHFAWLEEPYLQKVIAALEMAEPGSARFVGGCVRDSLFGETPKDFDIATTLKPQRVVDALKAAGLRSAPTGIDHGTITAIADHHGVEVTTLRADVSTDGRRATVAFTRDWTIDAGRRDFTINAIYLAPDGKIFDPVDGVDDVMAGRVAFIGDAEARIREDYLRILRFFRFSARFAQDLDQAGLAACAALKDGIGKLSAERIGAELLAILSLPRAGFALAAMEKSGVLAEIWDAPPNINAVDRLKQIAPDVAPPVVLAVLFGAGGEGAGRRLRLSNAEKSIRTNALNGAQLISPGLGGEKIRTAIYQLGKAVFVDSAAVAAANGAISGEDYGQLMGMADRWAAPVLPVSGRHIVEAGVPAGPAVAAILKAAEKQWIEEDFPNDQRAREILANHIARVK